jgi:hypothetical protein
MLNPLPTGAGWPATKDDKEFFAADTNKDNQI